MKRKIKLIIVGTKSGEAIRSARTKRRRLEMGCGCLFWLILAAAALPEMAETIASMNKKLKNL
jgi:hypothetical protein